MDAAGMDRAAMTQTLGQMADTGITGIATHILVHQGHVDR
jgi:hypothetical protein